MSEIQDIFTLAKQGEPAAIAALINHSLNPRGITARVGWKNHCLGILLEGLPIPDQQEMIAFVRQSLINLQPESLRMVKVGGYQPGQSVPAWYEEIELEGSSISLAELDYSAPSLTSWLNQGLEVYEPEDTASRPDALMPLSTSAQALSGQVVSSPHAAAPDHRFLRFYFNLTETALLPLSHIQQVLKVPRTEILPVPHMPDSVLGIYNWRGEMLWLIDLAQQLGFASVAANYQSGETVTAIVIHSDRQRLGMAIPRLSDIETHNLQQLQPPSSAFPAKLLSFMQGYFGSSGSPVLNAKTLIQDPRLQVHYPH
ncbi:MAG: hypothetical protein Kow00121_33640 [Elainellaceae cyanobacterium]